MTDWARVEKLARKMCEAAGGDPDAKGSFAPPYIANTPRGTFYSLPRGDPDTLWRGYAEAARVAIELLENVDQATD